MNIFSSIKPQSEPGSSNDNELTLSVSPGARNWIAAAAFSDTVFPGYALAANERAVPLSAYSEEVISFTAVASVLFHLALLSLFFVGWGTISFRQPGAEEGLPDNFNVSVITEADLKRLSSDPLRQEGPASLTPPAEAQTPVEAQPQPETVPAPASTAEAAAETAAPRQRTETRVPDDLSDFAARAAEEFATQMTQAFDAEATRSKTSKTAAQAAKNVKVFRPGAAHSGKSDAFTRDVIWALSATKPQGNGKWGSTIVSFVVSAAGQVQDLRILKSSGDTWLDTGALMAVKQARMPAPPSGLPAGDRTFHVEYISLTGGF